MTEKLQRLEPGQVIPYGGDRFTRVPAELADAFQPGDRLVVVQETGDLLHIPAAVSAIVTGAVDRAVAGFEAINRVGDDQISEFFRLFAARLADDAIFDPIAAANRADLETARAKGRSVTRLELGPRMRQDMIEGLDGWSRTASGRNQVIDRVVHDGWQVEQIRAGLGVIGFVFEGRPNVFADACGVLRSGNTVVFRIGSDALGTATAIVTHALRPALDQAGLPPGAVVLVEHPSHAAGWALFSDPRLSLAVGRGSGRAVTQLGAVARQNGIPVSLHGTGGAWLFATESADPDRLQKVVAASLDRKVCNTLNTVCLVDRGADHLDRVLAGITEAAAARKVNPRLHVTENLRSAIPTGWWEETEIARAEGLRSEPGTDVIGDDRLGQEWEWEESPEVTITLAPTLDRGVEWFNRQSPRFVAALASTDPAEHDRFFQIVDSPFVGDGFTRWVDGQYAFDRPELGLSNWQFGRLFGRGGILSGDSIFTIRTRMSQDRPDIRR